MFALSAATLLSWGAIGAAWVGRRLSQTQRKLVVSAHAGGKWQIIAAPTLSLREDDKVGHALASGSCSISHQAGELEASNQLSECPVETHRQEALSKLALLETTLDTIRRGLVVIDAQGRVPICNAQARIMLDLPDTVMDGIPTIDQLASFWGSENDFTDSPVGNDLFLRPKSGNVPSVSEFERANGSILQVESIPLHGDGGFVLTYTDVTAERQKSREMQAAKEAAEAASRTKDDFLANISHEMRTPLIAMIGYSDLLSNSAAESSNIRGYAERIQSAGAILLTLIDDILELGKIEAGVIDIRDEPFALSTLLSDALSIVRPSANERGLTLRLRTELADDVSFVGDQGKLRQILLNLLNNAIKFTPSGSVELHVRECEGHSGTPGLHLAVIDTGIGIAASEQQGVFQRFHQVDPSTDRRFGGAGLGLAIAKQLVERLGGRIGMESAVGQGSTFWFEVTLARPEALAHADPGHGRLEQRSRARILVAEDVELNQDLARKLLESDGHDVTVVSNGVQAVEAATTGAYDLVLMDLSMPTMDGLTAAQHIRNAEVDGSRTAIVICTANILPSCITAFHEVGIDAYLRKPLRSTELHRTINSLLRPGAKRLDPLEDNDQPGADTADIGNLITLIGPERVVLALEKLTIELQSLAIEGLIDPKEYRRLGDQAHTLISTAGLLDMTNLAERCRDFENACRDADGVDQAFERLTPAISQAFLDATNLQMKIKSPGE